ncbi:protein PLASTID MOVEMENT IMPAIRED 1 [Ipomoea triloba]|uniref:protein PLASTID MOVEMENT IMPAIRED 1 n=1 Tax=Ipomoea triloba TaxID=35885 RepID=UPI00125CEE2E|nr:protein PLASTID MOVEMENT IMPAIRED 1 [Ipomoea triloba]
MADYSTRRNSNTQLLQELEALSESLYQTHTSTTRRTASLVLPRTSLPPTLTAADDDDVSVKNEEKKINPKPRSRRMSLSPWRSRSKQLDDDSSEQKKELTKAATQKEIKKLDDKADTSEKRGLLSWKPIRALSHIGKQKLSCLFSVEVVAVQGLPASMNGLRLSVCVRKKETRDGAVQTMPSRVSQGAADFEETLFIRCNVYFTPGTGTHMKFEPRPFLIYAFAVDADELDFGKSSVDLTQLIQESIEKSFEGTRIRQWDTSFSLSGKAKGGELLLKLGFQIMEKDGGIGIYSQAEGQKTSKNRDYSSSSFARRQSKTSFSVQSPRITSRADGRTPSQKLIPTDLQGIDELNLDEPAVAIPAAQESVKEPDEKAEDLDIPDFDVVDKGVEIQEKDRAEDELSEENSNSDKRSVSSEVVKEIVQDQFYLTRMTELDSIAQQIKALESMLGDESSVKTEEETQSQGLDADEETVTREFLQMLEDSDTNQFKVNRQALQLEEDENSGKKESEVFLPDLGKGLGCVVQTRNGGYLASLNPLNVALARTDSPKLAMQMSKPLVLPSHTSVNGIELFQRMAAAGVEEMSSQILASMPMDELIGKTAEQIAFEGIASSIIQGRNKEGASSSAARTVAVVKSMANAMNSGRKVRISTGIWNVSEDPLTAEEILAFSMQKIEEMTVEALKIQAGIAEEQAPFDVSAINVKEKSHPLAHAVPLEDWVRDNSVATSNDDNGSTENIAIFVVVQLRDPLRQYEAVGGPMIALIQAAHADMGPDNYDEEKRFKVATLHVGGLRVKSGGKKNVWDTEKQRLTAMQWLIAYGLGKMGKKGKHQATKGQELIWSISSRIMADMWLKPIRNPDVKFTK